MLERIYTLIASSSQQLHFKYTFILTFVNCMFHWWIYHQFVAADVVLCLFLPKTDYVVFFGREKLSTSNCFSYSLSIVIPQKKYKSLWIIDILYQQILVNSRELIFFGWNFGCRMSLNPNKFKYDSASAKISFFALSLWTWLLFCYFIFVIWTRNVFGIIQQSDLFTWIISFCMQTYCGLWGFMLCDDVFHKKRW